MKRLLLALLVALSACGGPAEPADDAGKVDLDFAVATLDGGTFEGKTLAGKPAVLWFWAPWCPTCVAESPSVKQAATDYGDKVTIIGVAGLDGTAAMHRFVELTKVDNIPHLADEEGVVWKRFGVRAQSTFVLLDESGRIVYRGYLDEAGLERRLAELLESSP